MPHLLTLKTAYKYLSANIQLNPTFLHYIWGHPPKKQQQQKRNCTEVNKQKVGNPIRGSHRMTGPMYYNFSTGKQKWTTLRGTYTLRVGLILHLNNWPWVNIRNQFHQSRFYKSSPPPNPLPPPTKKENI